MSAKQSAAVDKALRLIRGGLTPYAAAKRSQIALSTVYRALKRHPDVEDLVRARRASMP
jgi:predicted transcriptional regulator